MFLRFMNASAEPIRWPVIGEYPRNSRR